MSTQHQLFSYASSRSRRIRCTSFRRGPLASSRPSSTARTYTLMRSWPACGVAHDADSKYRSAHLRLRAAGRHPTYPDVFDGTSSAGARPAFLTGVCSVARYALRRFHDQQSGLLPGADQRGRSDSAACRPTMGPVHRPQHGRQQQQRGNHTWLEVHRHQVRHHDQSLRHPWLADGHDSRQRHCRDQRRPSEPAIHRTLADRQQIFPIPVVVEARGRAFAAARWPGNSVIRAAAASCGTFAVQPDRQTRAMALIPAAHHRYHAKHFRHQRLTTASQVRINTSEQLDCCRRQLRRRRLTAPFG